MNNYQDRNGSGLDNTIVMFGSGAKTAHNSHNLPTLVAGAANIGLKHGVYWRVEDETRMSSAHVSILRALGIVLRQHGHGAQPDPNPHIISFPTGAVAQDLID